MMKLYYKPGACSLASHIILTEIGKPFAIEKVDTQTKRTENGKDFLAINEKGAVPVLETEDGDILTEGAAILQFIADSNGAEALAPKPGTLARARVQEMLNFTASELHKAFGPLFSPRSDDKAKEAARAEVARKFDWLESRLSDGRKHLTGDAFTVADAYAFNVAYWANFTGIRYSPWPKLKAFIDRVAERASVKTAMKAEGLI
jgi:glutathione S-transferase